LRGAVNHVAILLEVGKYVDATDDTGKTPLHCACQEGKENCVQLLLEWKANVNATDDVGRTPLHLACVHGHADCVRLLLVAGASVDARGSGDLTPLHITCVYDHADCAALLLVAGADPNAIVVGGETPLHIACEVRSPDCARLLLEYGADTSARAHKGATPLHCACDHANEECVELLLEHGADVNAVTTDAFGRLTPLHVACDYTRAYEVPELWEERFLRFGCGRLLVSSGASLEQRDPDHRTPLELLCLSCRGSQDRVVGKDREKLARLLLESGSPPTPLYAATIRCPEIRRLVRRVDRDALAGGRESLAWTAGTHARFWDEKRFGDEERRAVEGALRALLLADARRAGCELAWDAVERVLQAVAS
jgi:ankyrin repeat protein